MTYSEQPMLSIFLFSLSLSIKKVDIGTQWLYFSIGGNHICDSPECRFEAAQERMSLKHGVCTGAICLINRVQQPQAWYS